MQKLTIILCSLILQTGCSLYHYEHTTADGTKTALNIYSMREVKAAEFKIDKHGALSGGAEQLGANERLIETVKAAISKIP